MIPRRLLGPALLLGLIAGCGSATYRADLRPSLLQRDLPSAFLHCQGPAQVEHQSATEFLVYACHEVALYVCQDPAEHYPPDCTFEWVRASSPPAPPAEPTGAVAATPAPVPASVPPALPPAPQPAAPQPAPPARPSAEARAEADQLFNDARALVKTKSFAEACDKFARSDALVRTFGTMLNLGDCAVREGRPALAWQDYDEAARLAEHAQTPGPARFARAQATALEPQLWTIIIKIPDPRLAG